MIKKNKETRQESRENIQEKIKKMEEEKTHCPHPDEGERNDYAKNEGLSREPVGTKKIIENR